MSNSYRRRQPVAEDVPLLTSSETTLYPVRDASSSSGKYMIYMLTMLAFLALLAGVMWALLRTPAGSMEAGALNQTAVTQNLLDAFARTITEQDWHGNANLFVSGGTSTIYFQRAMTFLTGGPHLIVDGAPAVAPIGSWRQQMEVFAGGLSSNHLMLSNCNISFIGSVKMMSTCIASYSYTLAFPLSANASVLPTQLVAFQAQFEGHQNAFAAAPHYAGWQLTQAVALPNATSTLLSSVDTGASPPGAVTKRRQQQQQQQSRDPLDADVWNTLQEQVASLVSFNQIQTAIAVCKTEQYIELAALFDPYGNDTNVICNDLQPTPVLLESHLICNSESGSIDFDCLNNAGGVLDRVRTINSILPVPSVPPLVQSLDFTITGGFGVTIQGNMHGITIHNTGLLSMAFDSSPELLLTVTAFPVPTLHIDNAPQPANTVWAGPLMGGPFPPAFRLLTLSDIPLIDLSTHVTGILSLANGGTNNTGPFSGDRIIVSNAGGTQLVEASLLGDGYFLVQDAGGSLVSGTVAAGAGINVSFSGGIFTITSMDSITVVQVDLAVPTDLFQVTSVPIIENGTLSFVAVTQLAHTAWMGPVGGGPAVPSFRLLQEVDMPVISLTGTKVGGVLPVSRGGTNNDGSTWLGERVIMSAAGGMSLTEGTVTGQGGISIFYGPGAALTISGTGGTCNANDTISQSCLDISTLSCPNGALGAACIPSTLTLAAFTVTGPSSLGTSTTCAAPLSAPCYDISGQSCPGGYLNANCINPHLMLNSLTVNNIVVNDITLLNGTITVEGMSDFEAVNATSLYTNAIYLSGPMSCSPEDTISHDCYDISGISCTVPISSNCFPINLTVADLSVTNELEVNIVTCLGTPLGNDCIPSRVQTINGISPSAAPALDFTVTAGTGLVLTPGVNGITLDNTGVTSVSLSLPLSLFSITTPTVTTMGTLTAVLQDQAGNTFFAAPDGATGTPAFRSITFADLPAGTPDSIYYVDGAGNLSSSALSLALVVPSAEFVVAGSPITSPTGTFTVSKANQVAHSLWIGPNGGPAAQPTFRTLTFSDLIPLGLTSGQVLTGVTSGAPLGKTLTAGTNMIITEMAGSFLFEATSVDSISNISMTVPSYLTVTPATLSSSGTFAITANAQVARTFLGGPTSGGPADPAFRAITYGDLPALGDGQFYIGSAGLPPVANQLTAGSLITITPGPGTSTVSTSALGMVTLNMPTAVFDVATVSGINSQTLTVTFDTQAPGLFFAGPASGGAAVPTFRAIQTSDLPPAVLLTYSEQTSTTNITGFSTESYTVATGMSVTPVAGTYWCSFSTTIQPTTSSGQFSIALHLNGVIYPHTVRTATGSSSYFNIHTLAVITTPGGQAIDLRWRKITGTSGSASMYARSLYCLRIV